jgi:hypothetical protein
MVIVMIFLAYRVVLCRRDERAIALWRDPVTISTNDPLTLAAASRAPADTKKGCTWKWPSGSLFFAEVLSAPALLSSRVML